MQNNLYMLENVIVRKCNKTMLEISNCSTIYTQMPKSNYIVRLWEWNDVISFSWFCCIFSPKKRQFQKQLKPWVLLRVFLKVLSRPRRKVFLLKMVGLYDTSHIINKYFSCYCLVAELYFQRLQKCSL